MADMTVTWPGAIQADTWGGGVERLGGKLVTHDSAGESRFVITPVHDETVESVYVNAVKYDSTLDGLSKVGERR